MWKNLCECFKCDFRSRATKSSDWKVRRAYLRENTCIWVEKSPNTHLRENGLVWGARDLIRLIIVFLSILKRKWTHLRWRRYDFSDLIILGHILKQELLMGVNWIWLEWFMSLKTYLTPREHFWVQMDLIWLDWIISTMFEGKRVHLEFGTIWLKR